MFDSRIFVLFVQTADVFCIICNVFVFQVFGMRIIVDELMCVCSFSIYTFQTHIKFCKSLGLINYIHKYVCDVVTCATVDIAGCKLRTRLKWSIIQTQILSCELLYMYTWIRNDIQRGNIKSFRRGWVRTTNLLITYQSTLPLSYPSYAFISL